MSLTKTAGFVAAFLALCAVSLFLQFVPVHAETVFTTVYDYPTGVFGGPNGAFFGGTILTPSNSIPTLTGTAAWNDVSGDFDRWHTAAQAYIFDRLDIYLGISGLSNLPHSPASTGIVQVKIYKSDETWSKGELYVTSNPVLASGISSLDTCSGTGTTQDPYSQDCTASFIFPSPVTLEANQYYIFELTASGLETPYIIFNNNVITPGFNIVGASVFQSPFGQDGIQESPANNTGSVYMRLQNSIIATSTCTVNCNSSVLFLPGIEGSRLYRPDYNGGTDKLWEPGGAGEDGNQDERDLFLTQNGSSIRSDVYARERDVIESTPTGDVYGPFIQKMDALKANGTIADWEPIAYDWRLSLDEILASGNDIDGRIYYSGDNAGTSTPYIIQELHRLAATSKTGKVTIVAHSNGGLVTKRLTQILGPEASNLIDKIIFVAVPQAGTPQTVATGMHGYDQDFVGGFLITKATARTFASTSPMFFNLLPSAQYFSYVDDPVVTFDSSLPDWVARYGSSIHSQVLLDQFLTDSYGRINSGDNSSTGVNQPIQITATTQISASNALHNALDAWVPPSGVKLIQIAGWGIPKTPTGVTYSKKGDGVVPELNTTIDGDGTVVVPSALWTSTATGAENYWLNLKRYNTNNTFLNLFPFDHGKILATTPALNFISDEIGSSVQPISNYGYLSDSVPSSSDTRLKYSLHSPLTLNLYDDQGRHTGISTTTGYIEEQIPGTYYEELGDVKYLFLDSSIAGHIVMNGYASGTFTFDIDKFTGDTPSGSTSYTDVPTTPTTVVTTEVNQDISNITPLLIDQNGDGKTDTYAATDTGTLSLDQLLTNLTTAVQTLTIKDKQKAQLLNKIAAINSKIAKQIQKQTNTLLKLKAQISGKASKGKIDALTANTLSATLDDLIAQEALLPIDSSLVQQLKDQINAANITSALKASLLNKVAKLENLVAINKSISSMSHSVQRMGAKAVLSDADTQSLLNLLDQIQSAI